MKRILIFSALLLSLTGLQAQQNNIQSVLLSVEKNNKELQSIVQLTQSQKLEDKAENNLSDPSVSYAHLWKAEDKSQTIGELVVSQSFDFPTLYASRHRLNQLKANSYDHETELMRQGILLEAKELCLDIIMLEQQQELLRERLDNAQRLEAVYAKRLATGDANVIETNKIKLELLNVKTEFNLNETNLRNKQELLRALNGDQPVDFSGKSYPLITLPNDFQQLRAEVIGSSRLLHSLNSQSLVARKQIQVNRSQWLPKFELGYRRNTESGAPFNGVVVGFSVPLFNNRHKVKQAKTQAISQEMKKEGETLKLESELNQLYREAQSLQKSIQEYQTLFSSQQNLDLLQQALTGGQISVIEYFTEVTVIFQSRQNLLTLENQYQKAMAKLYKDRL